MTFYQCIKQLRSGAAMTLQLQVRWPGDTAFVFIENKKKGLLKYRHNTGKTHVGAGRSLLYIYTCARTHTDTHSSVLSVIAGVYVKFSTLYQIPTNNAYMHLCVSFYVHAYLHECVWRRQCCTTQYVYTNVCNNIIKESNSKSFITPSPSYLFDLIIWCFIISP